MSLPSGYKRLEYIQSSGTQYIDTGFNPNQNTSIYVEAELLEASSYPTIFGARNWDKNMYWMYNNGNGVISNTFITRFNSTSYSLKSEFGAKQIYSIDSGIAKVGSISTPISISNFQSQYSMFLFAANNARKVQYPSKMNLYSCKIYDNGALIRFYIPCKTSSGEVGLWDDVNSVFYGNAGTGAFEAGPSSLNLPVNISGTWKDANEAFVNIGGTWKAVEAAFVNIGGAWKKIG